MYRALPALLLLLATLPAAAQVPRITGVTPAAETVGAGRTTDIVATFDAPVDPATVTAATFRVFGRWSGPAEGTLAFENGDQTVRFTPAAEFSAGEWVLVQLARSITAADGTPMAHGYGWSFWTAAEPTPTDGSYELLSDITTRQGGEGNIISYGGYAGDLDNDGDSDLAITNEGTDDVRVFLNDDGFGPFTVHNLAGGAVPSPIEGTDFDGDGQIDLAVGNIASTNLTVMLGDGAGAFSSNTAVATNGVSVRGVAVADLDGDGADDVVTASRNDGVVTLLRSNGDGTFDAPETFDGGGTRETAVAVTDANGDGLLDLFVGDYSGGVSICLNDGDAGFTCGPKTGRPNGGPWMLATGDFDNDGDADVAVATSSAGSGIEVLFGDGTGGFDGTTFLSDGTFTIAVDAGDLDGDGDLDIVSSNFSSGDFIVFENDAGVFSVLQRLEADQTGSCTLLHDWDGDGHLDITGIDEVADRLFFFQFVGGIATEPGAEGAGLALSATVNPFRVRTDLRLTLPVPADVRLRVLDALGREVAVLVDGPLQAGEQVVPWNAGTLPAGRYLVRLEADGASLTAPLTLLR